MFITSRLIPDRTIRAGRPKRNATECNRKRDASPNAGRKARLVLLLLLLLLLLVVLVVLVSQILDLLRSQISDLRHLKSQMPGLKCQV